MSDFPLEALAPPSYDPGDPEQEEMARQALNLRRIAENETVRAIMSTYEGRAFAWMLLQESGFEEASIFCGEAPMSMSLKEGRRQMGHFLKEWVFTAAPERYSMLRREALEREHTYARRVGLNNSSEE